MDRFVDHDRVFERHRRVAFQFSGGRDSMAALFYLRDHWQHLTIYHLDTGDQFPETAELVRWVSINVPVPLEIVRADVRTFWATVGWPSDVVPVSATPLGRMVDAEPVRLVGRYDCCAANIMRPMHQRMLDDKVTLIVRGQRDEDYERAPLRSGQTEAGIEFLYPIEAWSTADVDAFIARHGLPTAAWYAQGQQHGSDCMRCSAWWDDGRMPYLQRAHPQAHAEVERRIEQICGAVQRQMSPLLEEQS